MRGPRTVCLVTVLLFPFASAAAEKGSMIRAGDLMAQPFIDAAKAGPLTAKQPVTILKRQGGWIQVEANGQTGWVRTLNVRLDLGGASPATGVGLSNLAPGGDGGPGNAASSNAGGRGANASANAGGRGANPNAGGRSANARPALNPASLLRTGSSGKTVTTGVKGLEEEDIKNATVNYAELEQLNTLGVAEAEARANAEQSKLKENKVDYLKGRR